jgi:hypothetical protein
LSSLYWPCTSCPEAADESAVELDEAHQELHLPIVQVMGWPGSARATSLAPDAEGLELGLLDAYDEKPEARFVVS